MPPTGPNDTAGALAAKVIQNCDFFVQRIQSVVKESSEWILDGSPLQKLLSLVHQMQEGLAELRRFETERKQRLGKLLTGQTQSVLSMAFQDALGQVAATPSAGADPRKSKVLVFPGSMFTLVEVLQFLGQNKKTGVVTVPLSNERISVRLIDGDVVSASSNNTPRGLRLGEVLVSQGAIDSRTLSDFLSKNAGVGKRLGEALESENLITADALYQAVYHQMKELFRRSLATAGIDVTFEAKKKDELTGDYATNLVGLLLEGLAASDADHKDEFAVVVPPAPAPRT